MINKMSRPYSISKIDIHFLFYVSTKDTVSTELSAKGFYL